MGTERTCNRLASVAACAVALASSMSTVTGAAETRTLNQVQRYCTTSWRNAGIHPQEWSDCTQEAIAELLERVSRDRLAAALDDASSSERRELNRAIWRVAQRWRRSPVSSPLTADVADSRGNECALELKESVERVLESISARQRQILLLWSQGWTIDEIGHRLGMSPARVSDAKYKAIAKLQREFASQAG